jgi:hypothetical protein
MFEQISSLGAEYAPTEEVDDALKQMVLSHPHGRGVVRELTLCV